MNSIPLLHLNGLGHGHNKIIQKLIVKYWRRAGLNIYSKDVNWYNDEDFDFIFAKILHKANEIYDKNGQLAIMGSSAGGSLALNIFKKMSDENKNVCFINDRGRLRIGNYPPAARDSLKKRSHGSQIFQDSVMTAEANLERLTEVQKQRILVLLSFTDLIVPRHLAKIDEARIRRSIIPGHIAGYFEHLLFARKTVADFAKVALSAKIGK
ncbi:hypothetical protein FWG95_02470 [Candidatus Saccharibacteria bacterium]|nr:hypothetical protein [Candidatus Saccharibacteria bacterium]